MARLVTAWGRPALPGCSTNVMSSATTILIGWLVGWERGRFSVRRLSSTSAGGHVGGRSRPRNPDVCSGRWRSSMPTEVVGTARACLSTTATRKALTRRPHTRRAGSKARTGRNQNGQPVRSRRTAGGSGGRRVVATGLFATGRSGAGRTPMCSRVRVSRRTCGARGSPPR
jgi:hypothetical protein